jgi:hypothetical protein
MKYIVKRNPRGGWGVFLEGATSPMPGGGRMTRREAELAARLLAGRTGLVLVEKGPVAKAKAEPLRAEAISAFGVGRQWRIYRGQALLAFVERLPAQPGEEHPWKVFRAIVGQGRPGPGEMVAADYQARTALEAARKVEGRLAR